MGAEQWKWKGKQSVYRYHIEDAIRFSIEHGHANKLSNDYSSTAYYYLDRPRGRSRAQGSLRDPLCQSN